MSWTTGKKSGMLEALHPLLGKLDQGLSSVPDQGPHAGSEDLEPLLQQRLPGASGPLLCHRFQDSYPVDRSRQSNLIRAKNVSSTAPMISRPIPPAHPS
jgi:hypothetical protein